MTESLPPPASLDSRLGCRILILGLFAWSAVISAATTVAILFALNLLKL